MPDSTQFMQETTNKDQERSSWTKVWSLKRADGRLSVKVPVSSQPVRFQDAHGISWSLKRTDGRLSVQVPVSSQPVRFQDAHGNQLVA